MDFRILEVLRNDQKFLPTSRTTIEGGDILLVEGKVEDLIKVVETAGIEMRAQTKLSDKDLMSDDITIVEMLVTPQSELIGQTLKESNFRTRYGMTTLAINRHGHRLREKIGRIPLRMGDLLLVQGPTERLDDIRHHPDLWILQELNPKLYKRRKGIYVVAFFAGAILVGGMGWFPLSISFLAAAILSILFRCIKIEEAYKEFIDWRLIVMIGGMTAFGTAMDKTGAAEFLAKWIVYALDPFGVMAILAGLFVLTVLLTQPMSNAAAALVVLPIAMETAHRLNVNPRTFAIGIMLAASVSLITPFEPSCILVYGPGKYRFFDFVKTGLILTIILALIVLIMLPVLWPLHQSAGLPVSP
jgi:di/tricarboxylate transporter